MGRAFSPLPGAAVGGCAPGPLAQAGISRTVGAQDSLASLLAFTKPYGAENTSSDGHTDIGR
jgi:hypothetical protein